MIINPFWIDFLFWKIYFLTILLSRISVSINRLFSFCIFSTKELKLKMYFFQMIKFDKQLFVKYVSFLNYRYEKWGQSSLTHFSDDDNSYSFDWIYLLVSGLSWHRLPFFFDDSSYFFCHLHLQFILTQFLFINRTRYHISIG